MLHEEHDTLTLKLSGKLDFEHCGKLLHELRTLFDASDDPKVSRVADLSAVEDFDMAGLQLLYSACRSARERGCTFELLPGRHLERLKKIYVRTGLPDLPLRFSGER